MSEVICWDTPATAEKWSGNTPEAFEAAVVDARRLASSCGKGWIGIVWENLGWHYQARSPCRRLEVSEQKGRSPKEAPYYTCAIHEPEGSGTPMYLHDHFCARTAKEAIRHRVSYARAHVKRMEALLEGLD